MNSQQWQVGLTSYHLKIIAALTMLIDHVGHVFYPEVEWLRIIGRVSFPLFVWLLVQGEAHTKSIWRYGARLGVLALISQPVYQAAFDIDQLNVLVQLLIGLVCLRALRQPKKLAVPMVVGCMLLSVIVPLGYSLYGMGLLLLTRYFRNDISSWLSWIGYHTVWALLGVPGQLPVIFVPLLFTAFNGERGSRARWFYGFYPGHLLLLALASE
ncbi:MAG: TraX family protein [Cyanobacteria bacterium J06560_5]